MLHNARLPWKVKKINLLPASYVFYTAHGKELAGASCLAGHRDVQTTSRDVHPPFEAGKRVNDARFRDTIWDTRDFYEEGEIANSLKCLADAEGFEPPTSASGAQCAIAFSLRFPGFDDSGECAVARETRKPAPSNRWRRLLVRACSHHR